MAKVWFCFERLLTPRGIPIPNQFRISSERFRRRQLFRFEFAPKSSLRVAESGESACGRDSGASECDNFPRVAQRIDKRRREIHHALGPEVGFGASFSVISAT